MTAEIRIELSDEQIRQIAMAVRELLPCSPGVDHDDLVDIQTAARLLGVVPKTVHNMLSAGRLQRHGIPRRPRASRKEIDALMRPRVVPTPNRRRASRGPSIGLISEFSRAARESKGA
jgi:hypothetical protein